MIEDVIARLYAHPGIVANYAEEAIFMPHNDARRFQSTRQYLRMLPDRTSRDCTPAPDDGSDAGDKQERFGAGLSLTFTDGPKAGPGFVFGVDSKRCDILLPNSLPSLSRCHCYLAFDAERQLILQDYSTHGTIVTYNGKGGQRRKGFRWIIGSPKIHPNISSIVIELHMNLTFEIVIPKRPSTDEAYNNKVDAFRQNAAADTTLFLGALGLQSNASTAAPSGTQTPHQDHIFIDLEQLGKGTFSTVTRVWDVSTGAYYASKKFNHPDQFDWKKEAALMRQIQITPEDTPHEHLVRLEFEIEQPEPQLILEYLPLGNLHTQNRQQTLSKDEIIVVLQQGLSALQYLHERTPPFVHRDIKPENILVQSRDPLHIKLGDFGLSKASENLRSLCGTYTYLAPEVARQWVDRQGRFTYTQAVDIWSFGVVILEYAYKLPVPGSGSGMRWCQEIVDRLRHWESNELRDILLKMIVLKPQGRLTASESLKAALKLRRATSPLTRTPIHLQQADSDSAVTGEQQSHPESTVTRKGKSRADSTVICGQPTTRRRSTRQSGRAAPYPLEKQSQTGSQPGASKQRIKRQRSLDTGSNQTEGQPQFPGSQHLEAQTDQNDECVEPTTQIKATRSLLTALPQSCERKSTEATSSWSGETDCSYPMTFPSDLRDLAEIASDAPVRVHCTTAPGSREAHG